MKTIKLSETSTDLKIGDITLTAYISNGETIVNIFTKMPLVIEPLSVKGISIKSKL